MDNPHLKSVLADFPDLDAASLPWPPDAAEWERKDLHAFVYSGGAIKPKKKKTEPPKAAGVALAPRAVEAPAPGEAAGEAKSAAAPAKPQQEPPTMPAASAGGLVEQASAFEMPGFSLERHAITMPVRVHCEDTTPKRHVRLESLVAYGERIRSLSLKQILGISLEDLKVKHKLAILAVEFVVEIVGEKCDVLETLRIDTTPEFPAAPLFPWETNLFRDSGELYMRGLFGLNLCSISDTGVYSGVDEAGYQSFTSSMRKWSKPDGRRFSSTSLRFCNAYEQCGKPFAPTGHREAKYVVRAADCDMYNVLFQARVPSMMEACHPRHDAMAMYVNIITSVRPGDELAVTVVFAGEGAHAAGDQGEPPPGSALFLCTRKRRAAEAGKKDWEMVLTAFGHYGAGWPKRLSREEIRCASMAIGTQILECLGDSQKSRPNKDLIDFARL